MVGNKPFFHINESRLAGSFAVFIFTSLLQRGIKIYSFLEAKRRRCRVLLSGAEDECCGDLDVENCTNSEAKIKE